MAAMQRAMPLFTLSHVVLWIEFEARTIMDPHAGDAPVLATAPEVRTVRAQLALSHIAALDGMPAEPDTQPIPVFHHVGLYAYRPAALKDYVSWPVGTLETLEGLEQLRFLENGAPVLCVEVSAPGRVFWELNNPVDVARIEAVLAGQSLSRASRQ